MGNFISNHVGTTTSQRLFLLLLFVQSCLDVAIGFIYVKHFIPAEFQPSNLRQMLVANVVLGLCFLGIYLKTNGRKSPLQLWGLVGVLFAFAAWEPVAPVLATLFMDDPHTKQPYADTARLLCTIKLSYRLVFCVLYLLLAIFIHRAYLQFHQVVVGYLTKPSQSIKYAWGVRFRFVSLMGVHAIQVIACVVAMFYMLLPHADIGHASIIVVMAVKAVVMVSALLGMVASVRESRWLMYGCMLALTSELVFFVYLVISLIYKNAHMLASSNVAEWAMMYGALSSLALSILSILIALVYAGVTIKTFGYGLRQWVKKEYEPALKMARSNPFKE